MAGRLSAICVVVGLLSILSLPAPAQNEPRFVMERQNSTISLEPYAPNIIRITLSLDKSQALAAPGFGFLATPLEEGRVRRALVVHDGGVAVLVIGDGHRPAGHLQEDFAFGVADHDVGRRRRAIPTSRNSSMGGHLFSGMRSGHGDDQAGRAIRFSAAVGRMSPPGGGLPAEHHPAHPPLLDPSDARDNVGG